MASESGQLEGQGCGVGGRLQGAVCRGCGPVEVVGKGCDYHASIKILHPPILSIHPFVHPFSHPFFQSPIHPSSTHSSVHPHSIHPSIHPPPTHPTILPLSHPLFHPPTHPSSHPPIYPPIHPIHPSAHPPMYPSTHPSIPLQWFLTTDLACSMRSWCSASSCPLCGRTGK